MDNNIKGIDISNNDNTIDFSGVAGDNVKYVYLKATEGKTFQDGYMDTYYNGCKNNNLKIGAYHFLVGTSEPEDQAQNFYDTIKKYTWDLIPMLDVETEFDELTDYVLRFINKFNELTSESNLKLGIYSYTRFISGLTSIKDSISNMPFWEANYNYEPWNLADTFFSNRIGHQYTETGSISGINCNCDINVFTDGVLLAQWVQNDTGWWYKYSDGTFPVTTWLQIDGEWYYFKADGYMATGWVYDSGNYYYLYNTGKMATGWQQIEGSWYYLNTNGTMTTGWIQLANDWYYLNNKGVMVTGWQQINDNSYYFYSDGKLAINTVTPDGYTVDNDGAWDSSVQKK